MQRGKSVSKMKAKDLEKRQEKIVKESAQGFDAIAKQRHDEYVVPDSHLVTQNQFLRQDTIKKKEIRRANRKCSPLLLPFFLAIALAAAVTFVAHLEEDGSMAELSLDKFSELSVEKFTSLFVEPPPPPPPKKMFFFF